MVAGIGDVEPAGVDRAGETRARDLPGDGEVARAVLEQRRVGRGNRPGHAARAEPRGGAAVLAGRRTGERAGVAVGRIVAGRVGVADPRRRYIVVVDPDGVYDPSIINDRLLLGLKGTMSEFELTQEQKKRAMDNIRTLNQILDYVEGLKPEPA